MTTMAAAFAEILERQAEGARLAGRFAHACLVELETDEEATERQIDWFRTQRTIHDAIAEEFDRLAFDLDRGGRDA